MRDVIEAAVAAALAGDLVVIPTDTVYGIGGSPEAAGATRRIFEAKRRPRDLTLPLLVHSPAAAEAVSELGERGRTLARQFWPGPLTIVTRRTPRSASWDLGRESATVGVRVPGHPLALEVLERTGPLAVTSANLSGAPTPGTCEEIKAIFGEAVAVYICADGTLDARSSTVVDVTGDELRILREDALSAAEILAAL